MSTFELETYLKLKKAQDQRNLYQKEYYLENKEILKEKQIENRKKNKEKYQEYINNFRIKHPEKFTKIECSVCNRLYQPYHILNHQKTKYHISAYQEKLPIPSRKLE